jgi:hypothetical protein
MAHRAPLVCRPVATTRRAGCSPFSYIAPCRVLTCLPMCAA